VTEDGTLREGLYPLTPAQPGEEAPVADMVAAALDLLEALEDAAVLLTVAKPG